MSEDVLFFLFKNFFAVHLSFGLAGSLLSFLREYRRGILAYSLDAIGAICIPAAIYIGVVLSYPGNPGTGSGLAWFTILSALSGMLLPIATITIYVLAGRLIGRHIRYSIERSRRR